VDLEFFRNILENSSNIKFNENTFSGSRVVSCGRNDMTKLIVAFRNFENAPKTPGTVHSQNGQGCRLFRPFLLSTRISIMKPTKMRCASQIARVTEARNVHNILVGIFGRNKLSSIAWFIGKAKIFVLQKQLPTSNINITSSEYSYKTYVANTVLILDILLYLQQVFWVKSRQPNTNGFIFHEISLPV
jgi:hypothetical protein